MKCEKCGKEKSTLVFRSSGKICYSCIEDHEKDRILECLLINRKSILV